MSKIITYPIKLMMLTAPFLLLILMLGALWGVTGKTTYNDPATLTSKASSANKASNVLVKETQSEAACAKPIVPEENFNNKSNTATEDKQNYENIDWDRIV